MFCGRQSRSSASSVTGWPRPVWRPSCAGVILSLPSMRLFYVGPLMNDMTMNDSTTHKEADRQQQEDAQPAPGAQLAAQRQALNWSIEQVANQLNLAPRQIQAIEADNYAALPGMASVRGFIRAYAKLLKIDAAPLLLV